MALDPNTLMAGDRLYQKATQRTNGGSRPAVFVVVVVEVLTNADGVVTAAMVRWNGNPPHRSSAHNLKKLFRFCPKPSRDPWESDETYARRVSIAAEIAADEKAAWKASGRNKRSKKGQRQ